jgi:predicted ribosomally synthesized peptide with nif11-like leader
MSEEQLKALLAAVKADAGLQEKLMAAADADAVVAIAKSAGFVISAEELQKTQSDLSDEELEGVAGGFCGMSDPLPIADNISQYVVGAPICFFFA